ncbi:MAG: RNA polymerase sigma-70 factor [Dysgonamonadaceae bacterium]|jgi:RNA polymerase sigma-70 factor (ECF subfamily)|nr:RNA polymerase sigma-70 factor [Dysgonamonadaceae bacterium]MDD3308581.1 RNA polymerase sigma-70 factor [Dysgonamonadaceae bacterium]MDD3899982.1 RNA polymerase sigma-70 factor [Dysgonamonadaceae bacterium]MDD4398659.1 RNA polymerase sigma-70 factor [Dysgonamonadaceae bacterium]MEA5080586.1 RNA polymerase sigma-70 factor [Dysgonamonadaceae bacterium]
MDKFHSIVLPLKNKLYRFALSIVYNSTEAEDIVQDIMLKLWSKKDEWEQIENLEAYCFKATKNLSLDKLAAKEIRKTESIDMDRESFSISEQETPFSLISKKETQVNIYKCIEQLTENQKMIFQLREIEDMSYKEIAETLDITEDSVKVNLFRARKKIKELLSNIER